FFQVSIDVGVDHLKNVHAAHENDHEVAFSSSSLFERTHGRDGCASQSLRKTRNRLVFANAQFKTIKQITAVLFVKVVVPVKSITDCDKSSVHEGELPVLLVIDLAKPG